jgi:anti-sigma B factor antagonist
MTEPWSKLKILEREAGDVTILDLAGEITLDDGDLAYRKKVHELLDRGRFRILLNLSGVTRIDSAGVGMLAAKLKTVREKHGDVKLVNLTTRSSKLFGMMKILTVFEAFDTEETALRSFSYDVTS